nr:unnamed protein product [Callosobruchus chinensis]
MGTLAKVPLTEEEMFCDAEEDLPDVKNLNVDEEQSDEYKDAVNSDDEEYSEGEEDFYDEYYLQGSSHHGHSNPQQASNKVTNYQPSDNQFKKYSHKINVEKFEVDSLPHHAVNLLQENEKRLDSNRIRTKDKHDRATAEQVMDPKTRMILFKLLNKSIISEINGCISTGKEANVYHASANTGKEYAIKIYKTSILIFKDRDKYVSGEFRFRHGYCKHNPRKMVRTWAEKEMRNLVRMFSNGLNVPEPVLLKSHVLIMSFIGKDGWPAPKLKDVDLTQSKAREIYRDVVIIMWKLYNKCKLVHADLSEFNMLYHNGQVWIIDVSQSVEHDHPHALEFLRKDCTNITEFFKKKEVATMTVKELFNFITDISITEENMEDCLEKLAERAAEKSDVSPTDEVEEEVFKQAYIPKRLTEVVDFERDINQVKSGSENDLVYKTLVGLKSDLSTVQKPELLSDKEVSSDETDSGSESGSSDSSDGEGQSNFTDSSRPRHETAEEKKARKKAVKEAKAEKRKTKYEGSFKPTWLRNWEVPKITSARPKQRTGVTSPIADEKGHLLPDVPRRELDPWGDFQCTWRLPKKIDRRTADKISGLEKLKRFRRTKKHATDDDTCKEQLEKDICQQPRTEDEHISQEKLRDIEDQPCQNSGQEGNKENLNASNIQPYVPGNLTEEKHRPDSYNDLVANRYPKQKELQKGFPKLRDDFSRHDEPEADLTQKAEEFCIGYKGYPGYGPTRCTKLKVYRPKSCAPKPKEDDLDAITSFDRRWRFIRQRKVSPMDLAICWDLTPVDPNDEPKPPPHIDGSNGSVAPAVFTLVHTPKEDEEKRKDEENCDGIHGCGPMFEHTDKGEDSKDYFFHRTKSPRDSVHENTRRSSESSGAKSRAKSAYNVNRKDNNSNHSAESSLRSRAKSATNVHEIEKRSNSRSNSKSSCSSNNVYKSTPNLNNNDDTRCNGVNCRKKQRMLFNKYCMACELKKNPLKDTRPKADYKMAFKAGVPQKTVSRSWYYLKIPRPRNPYAVRSYTIDSLAPPFSFQKACNREEYPEQFRLATVYQHSYKPIVARKRPLMQTVFK